MRAPRILIFLLLTLLGRPLPAQSTDAAVRLEPIAEASQLTAVVEPLSLEVFIDVALVYSGASGRSLVTARETIRSHIEALNRNLAAEADPRQTAEAALEYMHEHLLSRYDERQTEVHTLLRQGNYNCVSSGVLYAILVKSLGLRVWGVRTSDHAFCRVQAGLEAVDVETTSAFGFDPGKRQEFTDEFGQVTGFTYVPPSNYADRRDIGERELLGLILYNRTAFASERRQYAAAVPPAVDAYAVLGDEESYERLITSVSNLASWYGMSGRFEDAVAFLDRAGHIYENERLDALRGDLLHNWTLSLIQKGGYIEAEQLLDSHRDGRGTVGLGEEEWKDLTVYLYQVRAQAKAPGDYADAARLIREGLNKVGSDQGLVRSYEVYVHNAVVTLVRDRRYEEAIALLDEALIQLPHSAVLSKDRSMVLRRASENP